MLAARVAVAIASALLDAVRTGALAIHRVALERLGAVLLAAFAHACLVPLALLDRQATESTRRLNSLWRCVARVLRHSPTVPPGDTPGNPRPRLSRCRRHNDGRARPQVHTEPESGTSAVTVGDRDNEWVVPAQRSTIVPYPSGWTRRPVREYALLRRQLSGFGNRRRNVDAGSSTNPSGPSVTVNVSRKPD